MERLGVLVGGEWRTSGRLGVLPDINPADTEEVVAVFPVMDAEEMGVAVEAAADALPNWRALNPVARGAILLRTAELLRTRSEEIARDLVREMGKTLGEARGEVARAADFFQYYGGLGRLPMGDHLPDGRQACSRTRFGSPLAWWSLSRRGTIRSLPLHASSHPH